MEWLKTLNEAQRQAADAGPGPLLIIAGPGTGKTKTLTSRIAHLIATKQANAQDMLALTFTNKAAAEMRARVGTLLPDEEQPLVTTFHGLCHQLLSRENDHAISFISERDRLLLVKQLRKTGDVKELTTRELALELSRLKNLPPGFTKPLASSLKNLLAQYNDALREQGLYDFDDLLLQAHQLLTTKREKLPYTHILVDEFQDTNTLQYELLQLMRHTDNLCVIGDPLQSIYGFRGADDSIFERFQTDFPNHQRIVLTTNYRSTPQIVAVTNAVFPPAPQLAAHRPAEGEVKTIEVLNEYSEASWIVERIESAIGGSTFLSSHQQRYDEQEAARTFRDFAILYRTHHTGKTAQKALAQSGIPFQVVGDGSPYDHPHTWAVIQIMRYLAEPSEEREQAIALAQPLRKMPVGTRRHLLDELQASLPQTVSELATTIAECFQLTPPHMNEFTNSLVRFDTEGLKAYIAYIDSLDDGEFYDARRDAVTLMTIHSSKGLEFPHVFLVAAEEGILPHVSADIEEERRLFYVAVSRAQTHLDILHAQTRRRVPAVPSSFLSALPASILPRTKDATITQQRRRLQKRQAKQNQGTLFDI